MLPLAELTPHLIEEIIGIKLVPGNPAPLFNYDGSPIMQPDGTQLVLPYTHAAAYVSNIMGLHGLADATTTDQLADLPIPFWRHAYVQCVTPDGDIVVAVRSNATANAVGRGLCLAAGFADIVDGKAEAIYATAAREFNEETGLILDNEKSAYVVLEPIRNCQLQTYKLRTETGHIAGHVPSLGYCVGIKALGDADALVTKIRFNHELIGLFVVPATVLSQLADGKINEAAVQFYPSAGLNSFADGSTLLVSDEMNFTDIEQQLQQSAAKIRQGRYAMGQPCRVHVRAGTFDEGDTVIYSRKNLEMAKRLQDA